MERHNDLLDVLDVLAFIFSFSSVSIDWEECFIILFFFFFLCLML